MTKQLFPTEKHLQDHKADKFGYKDLSKDLLDRILLRMELPNCFGLYGNWGSGKSTMLHFLIKHLKTEKRKEYKNIKYVYFEPWKYEYAEDSDLLFALLNRIKETLDVPEAKWKKATAGFLTAASWGLSNLSKILQPVVGVDAGLNVEPKKIMENYKQYSELLLAEHDLWVDKTEKFRSDFEEIITNSLGEDGKLFIFVDDLDRCLPENTVRLLESIKNFLNVDKTLFVVAIDRRIVSEMIEDKYGLHNGYGDEYLMKIIHYYYELPRVEIGGLVEDAFSMYSISATDEEKGHISRFLRRHAGEPRKAKHCLHQFGIVFNLGGDKLKEYAGSPHIHAGYQNSSRLIDIFTVVFLATRFPKLFDSPDVQFRLNLISQCVDYASDEQKYNQVTAKVVFLSPEQRSEVEEVLRCGFHRGKRDFQRLTSQQLAGAIERLPRT